MSIYNPIHRTDSGAADVLGQAALELDREIASLEHRARTQEGRLTELTNLATFQREALDAAAIVAVTDRAGRITSVNHKFCELSGYSEAELIGSTHRIVQNQDLRIKQQGTGD